MELPDPLPLVGVDVPRTSPVPYFSKIEPLVLFQQAEREMLAPIDDMLRPGAEAALQKEEAATKQRCERAAKDGKKLRGWTASPAVRERWIAAGMERERRQRPEMFKVFCLALFAGLRRDEIDTLTWKQIDFVNHTIRIETNEFTHAKSEYSEATVDIDPAFTERLRQWMQESKSQFVITVNSAAIQRPRGDSCWPTSLRPGRQTTRLPNTASLSGIHLMCRGTTCGSIS